MIAGIMCPSWEDSPEAFLNSSSSTPTPTLVTVLGAYTGELGQENTLPFFSEGVLPATSPVPMSAFSFDNNEKRI